MICRAGSGHLGGALSLVEIAEQFQAALDGRVGGRVLEDLEALPVRIRYADVDRNTVDAISTLRLNVAGSDTWIPASALGTVRLAPALQGITRRNGERVNEVSAYLRQGALPIEITNAVLADVDHRSILAARAPDSKHGRFHAPEPSRGGQATAAPC